MLQHVKHKYQQDDSTSTGPSAQAQQAQQRDMAGTSVTTVSLAAWARVRTRACTFVYGGVEQAHHLVVARRGCLQDDNFLVYSPAPVDGGDCDTPLSVTGLEALVAALGNLHRSPASIHGTIGGHLWHTVDTSEIQRLRACALRGDLYDDGGHKLPPDLTTLEAQLFLLAQEMSTGESGCCLNGREEWV